MIHTLKTPQFLIPLFDHPLFRYILALGWTFALLVALLQSSHQPVVGPAAPPGDPDALREAMLTTGHIIGFAGLTLLWWWAYVKTLPSRRALISAILIALILGTVTEFLQTAVADRNASLDDLAVNWLTTLITAGVIARLMHHAPKST